MRRVPPILLLLSVATFGSGGLRYAHELEHRADHAHARSTHVDDHESGDAHDGHDRGNAHHGDGHGPGGGSGHHHHDHAPNHDPADCFIHSQLNLPLHDAGYVRVLVCVRRFVPFPDLPPAPPVRSRRPAVVLDSRGPPAARHPFPRGLA